MKAGNHAGLRARLLLLLAVALLPVALFAFAGVFSLAAKQRAQVERALVERARALSSAVDQELYNAVAALGVLALSRSLDTGNLRRFHHEAEQAVRANPDWDGIIVLDPAGERLLNTRVPFDAPIPGGRNPVEPESVRAVLAARAPVIGALAKGPGGNLRYPVRVPVERNGRLLYVLTAFAKPSGMLALVQRQKIPPDSVSTVFDSRLTIVARSRDPERHLGNPVSETLARLIADDGEGWGITVTRDGQDVYTAFSRSGRSGWGVALGVPTPYLDAPVRRSLALWSAGMVLSLVCGGVSAAWLARRIIAERTRALERANAELASANKELEAFSYSVSHDLRAPLRAIEGFSAMLQAEHGQVLPPEGRRKLDTVRESSQRMAQLINDLLELARFSRGEVKRARVAMRPLVDDCIATLRRDNPSRDAEWAIGPLADCEGDRTLIRQAWLNLIGNAFKYTRNSPAPRIEIGSDRRGGEIVYYVRDNGVGFDLARAKTLFGLFQRFHRREDFEGTGIGLAIVERVVHRHGGRIWAETAPGKGAAFYFTFGAPASGG